MADKTFNIYCDESCHLENDKKDYMLLSYISVAYNQIKIHNHFITELKKKHNFYGEIKWINVSQSQYKFYKELIDYFFVSDLRYRAVVINKSQISNSKYNQDYDTFYYKMYYQLLNHSKKSNFAYNVYIDIKDDLSANKVNKLKDILQTKFGVFRTIQNIHSHESILMQVTDVIMGALSHNLNVKEKKVTAKIKLIEQIRNHANHSLTSTNYSKEFNLFFIDLK